MGVGANHGDKEEDGGVEEWLASGVGLEQEESMQCHGLEDCLGLLECLVWPECLVWLEYQESLEWLAYQA